MWRSSVSSAPARRHRANASATRPIRPPVSWRERHVPARGARRVATWIRGCDSHSAAPMATPEQRFPRQTRGRLRGYAPARLPAVRRRRRDAYVHRSPVRGTDVTAGAFSRSTAGVWFAPRRTKKPASARRGYAVRRAEQRAVSGPKRCSAMSRSRVNGSSCPSGRKRRSGRAGLLRTIPRSSHSAPCSLRPPKPVSPAIRRSTWSSEVRATATPMMRPPVPRTGTATCVWTCGSSAGTAVRVQRVVRPSREKEGRRASLNRSPTGRDETLFVPPCSSTRTALEPGWLHARQRRLRSCFGPSSDPRANGWRRRCASRDVGDQSTGSADKAPWSARAEGCAPCCRPHSQRWRSPRTRDDEAARSQARGIVPSLKPRGHEIGD